MYVGFSRIGVDHGGVGCLGSLAMLVWCGSGDVAASVCMMLCMRLLECWNSAAMALIMLWMFVAWVLRVSVDASILWSVF